MAIRKTAKYYFVQNLTEKILIEAFMDLTMDQESFVKKYGFDRPTLLLVLDEVRKEYPEEKIRRLVEESFHADNIYVTEKRLKGVKEIRGKIQEEVWEDYQTLVDGISTTARPEILSEIMRRGMMGLVDKKKAGESVIRVAAVPEKML